MVGLTPLNVDIESRHFDAVGVETRYNIRDGSALFLIENAVGCEVLLQRHDEI